MSREGEREREREKERERGGGDEWDEAMRTGWGRVPSR